MKFKEIIKVIMYAVLVALMCIFGFKIISVLIITPILASYGSAYNFYSITGDASYFIIAKDFTMSWLTNIVILCFSILTYKIIKYKNGRNDKK